LKKFDTRSLLEVRSRKSRMFSKDHRPWGGLRFELTARSSTPIQGEARLRTAFKEIETSKEGDSACNRQQDFAHFAQ
jgi:hypothetical protein